MLLFLITDSNQIVYHHLSAIEHHLKAQALQQLMLLVLVLDKQQIPPPVLVVDCLWIIQLVSRKIQDHLRIK